MINTYLTWKFHIPAIITGALCYILLGIYFLSVISLIYLFISWLFRKEYIADACSLGLITPFTGKIKKIYASKHILIPEKFQGIELSYNFLSGYGIYFPDNFEIYDIVKNDDEIFINLKSSGDESMVIHFKKNIFRFLPKLWVFPGDRGKKGARMGFFPLGGKMFVYIPTKYKINYDKNSLLMGGITSFANN